MHIHTLRSVFTEPLEQCTLTVPDLHLLPLGNGCTATRMDSFVRMWGIVHCFHFLRVHVCSPCVSKLAGLTLRLQLHIYIHNVYILQGPWHIRSRVHVEFLNPKVFTTSKAKSFNCLNAAFHCRPDFSV